MQISAINLTYFRHSQQRRLERSPFRENKSDSYVRTGKNITFNGEPWGLYPVYDTEITSRLAISTFDKLKLGNYLDITHDTWFPNDEPSHSRIRRQNLQFLDMLTNEKEQAKFVEYYKKLTGFPNLAKVSDNIKQEFISATKTASNILANKYHFYEFARVLQAGYNHTCSVGLNKAFPGSDMDGAYIILQGSGNAQQDISLVERFKGLLWENTDQRILSYNHMAAFPQVYTVAQLEALLHATNAVAKKMKFFPNGIPILYMPERILFNVIRDTVQKHKYKAAQDIYNDDYVAANKFFIKLNTYFKNSKAENYNSPSKEMIKNFGFFLNVFRSGASFDEFCENETSEYKQLKAAILASPVCEYSNLLQITAIIKKETQKPKIKAREKLQQDFNNWPTEKQYDFIKTMIKASCGENEHDKYPEYFATGKDNFAPLLKALGKPEKSYAE